MSSLVPEPRELSDLPYASYLQPFSGHLERDQLLDTVHVDGHTFDEADADDLRVFESAFTSVVFAAGRLRRARFNDVWLHSVRWVAADLAETEWLDVETHAASLAGLEMFHAKLRRVAFHHCKLDSVNLRTVDLRDVSFVNCTLRDVDFGGASLTNVSFPGSKLEGIRFTGTRMTDVDFHQTSELGIAEGFDALGGATINSAQVMDLLPALCQVLNISVKDR